jgi:hypothetical protein
MHTASLSCAPPLSAPQYLLHLPLSTVHYNGQLLFVLRATFMLLCDSDIITGYNFVQIILLKQTGIKVFLYRPQQALGDPEVKVADFLDFRH